VIRLDPERTQVIRPGSIEGPGERTEIVRLPVKDKAAIPAQRGPNREQPPEDEIRREWDEVITEARSRWAVVREQIDERRRRRRAKADQSSSHS